MENQEHFFNMQTIPMEAACNPLLSPADKLIFASLYFLKEASNGPSFASDEYLADYNQLSIITVGKALKTLEDLGYIQRKTETKVIKKATRSLPAKFKRQRQIYIEINPIWTLLMNIWNWAYPQKKEDARDCWWDIREALKTYKNQQNKKQKTINLLEIQELTMNIIPTYKNIYVGVIELYNKPLFKSIDILKDIIKKDNYKKGNKDMSTPPLKNNSSNLDMEKSSIKEHNKITSSMFDQFYNAYPRKINKPQARKAFIKITSRPIPNRPTLKEILIKIKQHSKTDQWQETKNIPHPSTWLNKERWEVSAEEIEAAWKTVQEINKKENKDKEITGAKMSREELNKIESRTKILGEA